MISGLKLFALTIAFSMYFVSAPVSADPGGNHKAGKNGHYKGEKRNKGKGTGSPGNGYPMRGFDERQRLAVQNYFTLASRADIAHRDWLKSTMAACRQGRQNGE